MTGKKIQQVFGVTIAALVLCVVAIAFLFNWLGTSVERLMAQKFNQEQLRVARHIKARLMEKFSGTEMALRAEARSLNAEGLVARLNGGGWGGFEKTARRMAGDKLIPIVESNPHFLRLAITGLDGRPAVLLEKTGDSAAILRAGAPGDPPADRFAIAPERMSEAGAVISKPHEITLEGGGKEKREVMEVSVPLMRGGAVAGRIFLSVGIDMVVETVSDFDPKRESYDHNWIFNDAGELVFCSLVNSQEYHQQELDAIVGRGEGTYDISNLHGRARDLISVVPVRVGDNRWNIAAESSFEEALGIVQNLHRVRLLVVTAMLALVVVGGFAFYRSAVGRLLAEEKIRFTSRIVAEEEKFRRLIELAPDPVLILDDGLRIMDCNLGAVSTLKKEGAGALMGVPFQGLLNRPGEFVEAVRSVGDPEGSFTSSLSITGSDGKTLHFENKTAKLKGLDDERPFYQVYLRNVTDRMEYEAGLAREKENLDRILTSVGAGLAIYREGVELEWANRRYAEIFSGHNRTGVGERCGFCRNMSADECAVHRTFADGRALKEERTMQLSEGDLRHYLITTTPVMDNRGGPERVVEMVIDVTDKRTLEQQLLQSEKLASIGELASGIAHELNNPIAGIVGFSEFLKEDLKGQEGPLRDAERIHSEAMRCAKIVQNLLTFARRHKPQKAKVSLNEVIDATTDIIEYEFKVNNVVFEKDYEKELQPVVGDHYQLQQVFLNILNNAFYCLKELRGPRRIRIVTRNIPGGVSAQLFNNGPKIPDGVVNKLFDPFFTTKEVGQGTGLGLSVSHGIIKAHHGEIVAANVEDGVTFTVTIPLPG